MDALHPLCCSIPFRIYGPYLPNQLYDTTQGVGYIGYSVLIDGMMGL